MGHIVHMHGQPHRDTQELLPWYVTGRLDPDEIAQVERHLGGCAECRDAVAVERKLAEEIAGLPLDAQAGWDQLRRRIVFAPTRPQPLRQAWQALRQAFAWPGKLGWVMAGQLAMVAAILLVPRQMPAPDQAPYHALGDPAAQRTGNVIVIFRPETPEAALRRTLDDHHARLVDGPTAAGAYVIEVPGAERAKIIAALQRQPDIVLAQPIDSEASR